MVKVATCDLYLSHGTVAPLCVGPHLHHVVALRRQGEVDVAPAGRVQGALRMALLSVQDLDTHTHTQITFLLDREEEGTSAGRRKRSTL